MRNQNLLSVNELAEYTGLKKSYIYKLVSTGKLSGYKAFGKMLRFDKEEIDKILKSNKTFSALENEIEANTYSITKKA